MIKAIIFDLWDTLGTKNVGTSKTLMQHFYIEKTPDFMVRYETAIQLSAWKSGDDLASNFLKSFNLPIAKENLKFITTLMQEGIDKATLYPGMEDVLKELKATYKLGILSNTTVFEAQVPRKWGIDRLFDAQVYSWQIKSLKPAKLNFDKICSELGAVPSECLFIDDGETNVMAARKYGFYAIRYESTTQLRIELRNAGVNMFD